jgi:hypothetical protein
MVLESTNQQDIEREKKKQWPMGRYPGSELLLWLSKKQFLKGSAKRGMGEERKKLR